MQAIGSRPLHSGHSPHDWLQWMTTSSPGFQRGTPGPTAATMPGGVRAADVEVVAVYRKIETGLPIAAQTRL